MSIQTNVRRRGAVYHFRLRLPADLVDRFGRPELARSLKTTSPSEARRRAAVAARLAYEMFTTVRDSPDMTPDEIATLARRFYDATLTEQRELAALAPFSPRAAEQKALEDAQRPGIMRALAGDIATHRTLMVRGAADELLERHGIVLDRESLAYGDLCAALARAQLAALAQIDGGASGADLPPGLLAPPAAPPPAPSAPTAVPPVASPPPVPASAAPDLPPESRLPLSDLIEDVISRRGLRGKYAQDYCIAVRWFEEACGKKPVSEVSKRDAIGFKKLLEMTPTNSTQRYPGKTIREAAELNKRRAQPHPTLNSKTITKWISPLRVVFGMLAEDMIVEANPFDGVRAQPIKGEPRRKKRDPFTDEQLRLIFNAPMFTGAKSEARLLEPGPFIPQDHRRWAPLVALYSGARPTEIAQLELNDIIEQDGVLMFSVNNIDDEDDDEGSATPRKRVKTEAGVRLIPVHRELIRLGFLDYVKAMRKAKAKRLFESWKPTSTGDYIATFPRFFNRTFLPKVKAKTKKTSFYSFRHTFKDAQRRAGLPQGIEDALFGHADQSVAGIYGSGAGAYRPRQLADAMDLISYDGIVDLSHLIPR